MVEPHQTPYPFPQQQQGMAAWYGVPPHAYQPQQAPVPPMQHHSMPWSAAPVPPPPPGEQAYNYMSQLYHPPPQSEFYPPQQQVHHQYAPPPQPAQPQFTYMYGPQDQVWQANNSWGHQQWPYPAQNASLSQEEVWAAKARAWAASKAVQEEARPPASNAPQMYQEYMYQPQEPHPSEGQQHSLQPPGQEAANSSYYQNTMINQGQNAHSRTLSEHPLQTLSYDQPMQDASPLVTPESVLESLEHKAAQGGGQLQQNDMQSAFSSGHVLDAAANYKLDTAISGPLGPDRPDHIPQLPPKQLPAAPVYTQQATHLLPQSQASPLSSQPRLTFSDKLSPSGYEHQQQQASSSYIQPPAHQQPPTQVQHQPPKLPLQPHYQSSVTTEGVEGEFGPSPSLRNWAPVGGPGMPFPPAMGAGSSQFDPLHTPHQIHAPWRPDGAGLQGLGFPSSTPFVVGSSPGVVPGAGAPGRPLFAPESYIERPKKAAVPSWLREEIMKKKATGLAGNATGMLLPDESSRVNGGEPAIPSSQRVGISDKLRSSTPGLSEDEEEDQEEEIEAARNAAINLEIKRLLTEVLLKVTGDLFEEIAQEVLDEDDSDTLQGKSSPDERSQVIKLTSPSSPGTTPPASGRVLVSSIKNPDTVDSDKAEESSDSDTAAGDVLGLGNYASDDETGGSKEYQEPLHGLETKTEKQEARPLDSVDHLKAKDESDAHGAEITDGLLQSTEPIGKEKHARDKDTSVDTQSLIVKQEGRQPEDQKPLLEEDKSLSGVKVHLDTTQNGRSPVRRDVGTSITHAGASMLNNDSKTSVTESRNAVLKGEWQHRDKDQPSLVETGTAFNTRVDALLEKPENKEAADTIVKDKRKEEKGEGKARDLSSKEKRREEKPKVKPDVSSKEKNSEDRDERRKVKADISGKERNVDERSKDHREAKLARGSARVRDSSRDRRKEKDKEKSKARERESDRDRRKQEKREREGRSRRADGVEKKARHRSSSSSSSEVFSSNSDRSRGRSRARRSSRHHVPTSSPDRSRKRRASRSRSRSRSPHVKHTHRRNVPSPSHDKSRKSGSKSPAHRRGRG